MTHLQSTALKSVSYDETRRALKATFRESGKTYIYEKVPQELYDALLFADSIGACDPGMELVEDLTSLAPLLAELDERDRMILEMRFGREWTQSEIGDALGISQMHVSRLLNRTLKTLRAGLLSEH